MRDRHEARRGPTMEMDQRVAELFANQVADGDAFLVLCRFRVDVLPLRLQNLDEVGDLGLRLLLLQPGQLPLPVDQERRRRVLPQ